MKTSRRDFLKGLGSLGLLAASATMGKSLLFALPKTSYAANKGLGAGLPQGPAALHQACFIGMGTFGNRLAEHFCRKGLFNSGPGFMLATSFEKNAKNALKMLEKSRIVFFAGTPDNARLKALKTAALKNEEAMFININEGNEAELSGLEGLFPMQKACTIEVGHLPAKSYCSAVASVIEDICISVALPGLINLDLADFEAVLGGGARCRAIIQTGRTTRQCMEELVNGNFHQDLLRRASAIYGVICADSRLGLEIEDLTLFGDTIENLASENAEIVWAADVARNIPEGLRISLLAAS
ncbi:MAG: twin-arginine translocation signal domain-containing protein [Desulfatibacillaceae bacterium]|nr:twin-arginine translocation signal domain-containing protein [Desulfatibacillaceae bacterium]